MIFHWKLKFRKISPKTKISLDLLENLHTSQFEDNKDVVESNKLRYYIYKFTEFSRIDLRIEVLLNLIGNANMIW